MDRLHSIWSAAWSGRLDTGWGFLCWQCVQQVLWSLKAHNAMITFWCSSQAITGLYFSLTPVIFGTKWPHTHKQSYTNYLNLEEKFEFGWGAEANIVCQAITRRKKTHWPGTMVPNNNSQKKLKVKRGGGGCRGGPIVQFPLTCCKHTTNRQNSREKLANRQQIEQDKKMTTLMLCVQSLNPFNPKPVLLSGQCLLLNASPLSQV